MHRKSSFSLAIVLGLAIAVAGPAWAVPPCWQINYTDCNATCHIRYDEEGEPPSGCEGLWIGECNENDSRPYTYYCKHHPPIEGFCVGCEGCFLGGTMITMADGTSKPIESIEVGDIILAYDETSGEMKPDTVLAVQEPIDVDFHLVVNGLLQLTPSHPVLSGDAWIEIGQLQVGDTLTAADGSIVPVETIERVVEPVTVYNFTVNPYHTYVANGIIVHNKPVIHPFTQAP